MCGIVDNNSLNFLFIIITNRIHMMFQNIFLNYTEIREEWNSHGNATGKYGYFGSDKKKSFIFTAPNLIQNPQIYSMSYSFVSPPRTIHR
jgi:hypothetical protein